MNPKSSSFAVAVFLACVLCAAFTIPPVVFYSLGGNFQEFVENLILCLRSRSRFLLTFPQVPNYRSTHSIQQRTHNHVESVIYQYWGL
jgi:hypothetical protein